MVTVYKIRRKQLVVLIISLLLASSFYFIPLSDGADQRPSQLQQVQEPLPPPLIKQPQSPSSTSDTTRLADRQVTAPSLLQATAHLNQPSPPVEALLPKQVPGAQPQPADHSSTPPASPHSTVRHLSTQDFSPNSLPSQNHILHTIQDNRVQ